jgi:cytochrome c oxidase accessory protein FixG
MNARIPLENVDTEEASVVQQVETEEFDLYEKREKIYTRKISGFFQRIRLFTGWPLLIAYFALPWINWDARQSVLFDVPNDQFHIFGLTLWPEDLILLAAILIIAAMALLAVTTWLGRVWCGYTCPQTVWTSIFMWAEQVAEGSRNARIKLDQAPWSFNKVMRKTAKHSIWLGVSLLTAISFVGYFTPVRELVPNMFTFTLGGWETFWILFFVLGTYGNAGWLREQVCKYMCPYARFQAVMFDSDTLIVSYDAERGESRGTRKKDLDYKAEGMGDCIDCQICVQVCPVGIDIRDGLQYECINCALCIDACNEVMDKMDYSQGLIRYTTENKLQHKQGHRLLRAKLIGFGAVLLTMISLFAFLLFDRGLIEADVTRDRGQLYQQTNGGLIQNVYTLSILNMAQDSQHYRISLQGLEGAVLKGKDDVEVASGKQAEVLLRVLIDPALLTRVNTPVEFVISSWDKASSVIEETRFIGPGRH